MSEVPEHLRHKPATELEQERELVLVCPEFKSKVNLSRIVRLAGCAGVRRIIACGNAGVDSTITRDAMNYVRLEKRRSMIPVLKKLRSQGFRLVGLEQTDRSDCLFDYRYKRKTGLVIGHERHGMLPEELSLVDDTIEIPVYGEPHSYNVATATTMAVYEYCRQFPAG
ncbi:MAG: TrmH family RNA methyltransferase [Planctomycetota bacterium]